MSTAEIDRLALSALRLLPDEPEHARRVWAEAAARVTEATPERTRFRLHVVQLNDEARFGDRDALGPRLVAAAETAEARDWPVEGLLVSLLVLFLSTLGNDPLDAWHDVEAVLAEAERHLDPVELSGLDLMAGHFRGLLHGWAEEQACAYRALNRLIASPDAPPGLVANTQKSIGYSHLMVQNLDLARGYLEDAWRLYAPLPLTARKLAAIKAWAQCLLVLDEPRRADAVMQPLLASRAEAARLPALSSALLVAAEAKLALGDPMAACELLDDAAGCADPLVEPAVLVHVAYVRALCLARGKDAASTARAAEQAEEGCARIGERSREIAVQNCLELAARLQARAGHYERAYVLQCRLVDMRAELSRKAAEIRHIDLHVDHQTHLARVETEHARRERALAETAEAAIVRQNRLLEQRLREVERLQESLRELAHRDALTGLFNRRYLGEALPGLLARGARLTLVLIDLDHFKAVNDRFGHQMGDRVLEGFAELLRAHFPAPDDLCCRYGGEEFCVLLAGADDAAARRRLDALLARLSERVFRSDDKQLADVGFSAGIVTFDAGATVDMDRVFRHADEALYAAKDGGRRRIASFGKT